MLVWTIETKISISSESPLIQLCHHRGGVWVCRDGDCCSCLCSFHFQVSNCKKIAGYVRKNCFYRNSSRWCSIFVNVASMTKLIPMTGVRFLYFIRGSSMVSVGLGIGNVQKNSALD